MAHKRTAIRDQAFTLVGAAYAWAASSTSRLHDWQVGELPGFSVYTTGDPTETSEPSNVERNALTRTLRLAVDIRVKSTGGDPADDVDALCVAVEQAMAAFPIGKGRLTVMCHLAATRIGLSGEGDYRHAAASLEYQIVYRTDFADPSS